MNGTCNTYLQYSAQKTTKPQKSVKMSNVISYNLRIIRIIQEYSQPKIGRKIRIFSLGRKNNILIKKKSVALKKFRPKRDSNRCAIMPLTTIHSQNTFENRNVLSHNLKIFTKIFSTYNLQKKLEYSASAGKKKRKSCHVG